MKRQITRISGFQTAKVIAVLWLIMTLPMILLMSIPIMLMPGGHSTGFGWMLIFMPIFYAFFGFVFTLFGAWVYNLVAERIGGIEFELSDAEVS